MSDEFPEEILYVSAAKFSKMTEILQRPVFGVGNPDLAVLEVAKLFDPPLKTHTRYRVVVNDWSIPTQ